MCNDSQAPSYNLRATRKQKVNYNHIKRRTYQMYLANDHPDIPVDVLTELALNNTVNSYMLICKLSSEEGGEHGA